MARTIGGTLSKICSVVKKKVRTQHCGGELKNTRTTLLESFIVGNCLILELELDIDLESKVLMESWSMLNID